MNTLEWSQECQYISDTTDDTLAQAGANRRAALRNFNGDMNCFVRYCEMQRNTAAHEGRDDSAQYIQHCLDDLTQR